MKDILDQAIESIEDLRRKLDAARAVLRSILRNEDSCPECDTTQGRDHHPKCLIREVLK